MERYKKEFKENYNFDELHKILTKVMDDPNNNTVMTTQFIVQSLKIALMESSYYKLDKDYRKQFKNNLINFIERII